MQKTNLLRLYFWDVLGRMGSQLISMVISIVIARYLTPADYGSVGVCLVFISFFDLITNSGLGSALVQRSNLTETHLSSSYYFNIGFGAVLTGVLFLSAPLVSAFFRQFDVTNVFRVLCFTILITSFRVVQESVMIRELAFKKMNQAKLIATAASGVIGILMAVNGFTIWSLVAQVFLFRLFYAGLLSIYSKWRPERVFHWSALQELWRYGFNMFLSGFVFTIFEHLDSLIIARIFSPLQLGLFSRAKSLNRMVVKYSSDSLGAITFPALAKIQDDRPKFIETGLRTEKIVSFIAFGLLGWLYLVAEPLILLLLGKNWVESISYFKILCLSGFAFPVGAASLSLLKAAGHSGTILKLEMYKRMVFILGLLIGFAIGMEGYMYALFWVGCINTVLTMYLVGKTLNISLLVQLRGAFVYVVPSVGSVLILNLPDLQTGGLIGDFIVLSLLYAGLYLLINGLLRTFGFREVVAPQIKRFYASQA